MSLTNAVELDIEPITPHFGSYVLDVDLVDALDDQTIASIRAALVDRKLLVFSGQRLTPALQVAFGNRFGELTASHPVMPSFSSEFPEIWQIDSADGTAKNDEWHTDVTFVKTPPLGSILRAVEIPTYGGDTLWADLQQAYESLSPAVQQLVDGLYAEHDGTREFGGYLAEKGGNDWDGRSVTRLDPATHPVVRVHPESGRKGLFVNPWFTTRILGVSDAESRHILDLLYAHITRPDFVVKHRWSEGDVLMWDNRSTVHYAVNDYGDTRRIMHRVTIKGDEPVGPCVP